MPFKNPKLPTNSVDFQPYQVRFYQKCSLVLKGVQLTLMTRIYTLAVNGQTILEVDVEAPRWLPIAPQVNRRWLRSLVAMTLKNYFSPRTTGAADRVYLN